MPPLRPSRDHDHPTQSDVDRLSRQIAELALAVERHDAALKVNATRIGQLKADISRSDQRDGRGRRDRRERRAG
jgi:hypothetical protein